MKIKIVHVNGKISYFTAPSYELNDNYRNLHLFRLEEIQGKEKDPFPFRTITIAKIILGANDTLIIEYDDKSNEN